MARLATEGDDTDQLGRTAVRRTHEHVVGFVGVGEHKIICSSRESHQTAVGADAGCQVWGPTTTPAIPELIVHQTQDLRCALRAVIYEDIGATVEIPNHHIRCERRKRHHVSRVIQCGWKAVVVGFYPGNVRHADALGQLRHTVADEDVYLLIAVVGDEVRGRRLETHNRPVGIRSRQQAPIVALLAVTRDADPLDRRQRPGRGGPWRECGVQQPCPKNTSQRHHSTWTASLPPMGTGVHSPSPHPSVPPRSAGRIAQVAEAPQMRNFFIESVIHRVNDSIPT